MLSDSEDGGGMSTIEWTGEKHKSKIEAFILDQEQQFSYDFFGKNCQQFANDFFQQVLNDERAFHRFEAFTEECQGIFRQKGC